MRLAASHKNPQGLNIETLAAFESVLLKYSFVAPLHWFSRVAPIFSALQWWMAPLAQFLKFSAEGMNSLWGYALPPS
jgi:hypothetical protein